MACDHKFVDSNHCLKCGWVPPPLRIYGPRMGEGSFTQVTRGFLEAARDKELLAGFLAIDALSDDVGELPPDQEEGATAPVAVNCGSPSAVGLAARLGMHRERWLMLAPNSDTIPHAMAKWLPEYLTGLLTPSAWGKQVLERWFELPIVVCPHGVHPAFRPLYERRARVLEGFRERGEFRVLHLTSTNAQRKGTRELLDAWKVLMGERKLPRRASLTIVAPHEGYAEQAYWVQRRSLAGSVVVRRPFGVGPERIAEIVSQAHLVCQPSRAEGFGLVPLEAACLGVPTAITLCTGHLEHRAVSSVIEHAELAPIDDFEGALAPRVTADAVASALMHAASNYEALHVGALQIAEPLGVEWTWAKKTGPVLEQLCQKYSR